MIVLTVGASSGLGFYTALRLAKEGHTVYAGARSFGGGKPAPEGTLPVALDVTDDGSVRAAVERVVKEQGRIDAVVNCAAFFQMSACEETDPAVLTRMLDTDFVGMARVVRAALPHMRAQGGGRIVNFSSLNGLFAIPFQGAYTACKHAVEGWSEALRMETAPFGISVTLIEPGDCRGGSRAYRLENTSPDSPYAKEYASGTKKIARDESGGMDPDRVARAVARVLAKKRPPMRKMVARPDQALARVLHAVLPGSLFARIIRAYYC